jgi:hypothetical protein
MSSDTCLPAPYSPPVLQTRTMEQAKLLLVGHAWIGHCGARELLELLVRQEHERIQVTGKLS